MRKLTIAAAVVVALAVLGVMVVSAASVPMKLDPSFGWRGRVLVDVGGPVHEDEPFHLIMQPDGKFVIPGKAYNSATGDFDFIVMRFSSSGLLDTTFDGDGKALLDIQGGYDEALGLVMQPDGKLVAAGFGKNPATGLEDTALARFNADGTLDTTFGDNGIVITDFFGTNDRALSLVIQRDGKLVAGGFAQDPVTGSDFALSRYNTDGALDTSYGYGGLVTTDFLGGTDAIHRLTIQPDQKVVGVGVTYNSITGNHDVGIGRYNADGNLDEGFATYGKKGVASTDILGSTDYALAVLVQNDGKILVGGLAYSATTNYDFALIRYNADGTTDQTFATYGKPGMVTSDFFQNYDQILALAVQPDGKILAAGHAKHPQRSFEFALARYNTNGTMDASFGYGGRLTTDFFGGPDGIHGLVLQPDGKAVVAGDALNPYTQGDDFALARYLVADPSWISGVVSALPDNAFANASARADTLAALSAIQADIDAGSISSAVSKLNDLRGHVNGCSLSADADDWIVACVVQLQVRGLIDQVKTKLGG